MDFRTYRPQRGFGRSERSLAKIAEELTRFLTKAQRSLTYDTLHLSSRQRETLAHIVVEFAEDLSHDIGIWRSLEHYNRDFFGTPLPCVLQPDETMDPDPVNPDRIQFLLWTLYAELEPGLILAPNHQDLERLALWIAEFLSTRLARLRYDSAVKTFLTTPNTYGWDVKRKLVWMGQHSYLFRLPCAHYVRDHGGNADIPTLDDFLCQETTHWSGLGAIDMLAATLDITYSQRYDVRHWYECHMAYFRVVSLREPFMDVINRLNEQPYTIHGGEMGDTFRVDDVVFGSLVPWDRVWYWSGVQQKYEHVTDEVMQQIKKTIFLNIEIPFPPLPEQRAIAQALHAVQEAKATRQQELTLERERKAALMDYLFTHGTRGEARKQTEIGEIPESWAVCSLGDVSEIAYGLTVNQERRRSTNFAPYLAVANVTRGALRLDDVKQIGMLDGDAERYRLKKGDVLLIEGSGNPKLLGSAAVWNGELPFVLHQNHLIRARFDQSKAVPEWMMDYLNSDSGRAQLLGKSKTSSDLHNINSSVVASLKIPLPSRHEQEDAACILRSCEEVIVGLEKELSLLDELFQAMLEELMTGRVPAIPLT